MASRILHLAVAEKIIEQIPVKTPDRFRLGNLLPDAYREGVPTAKCHFKIAVCGDSKKTYDLEGFRNTFREEIKTDTLYLGYYLHLIQDLVFRRLVYDVYNWNPRIPGNVERLWGDYERLNPYIIAHYGLKNFLELPINFFDEISGEKINTVYPFDIHKLRRDLNHDFEEMSETQEDVPFFYTKEMAAEFIDRAAEVCIAEIMALEEGKTSVCAYDYAWWNSTG